MRQLPQVDTVAGRLTADITLPAASPASPPPGDNEPDNDPGRAARRDPATSVYALTPEPARRIVAEFVGAVAGSAAELDVRMLGEQLEASFDAKALSPATLTKLVPALSPESPAALSAKVEGDMSDLRLRRAVTPRRGQAQSSRPGPDGRAALGGHGEGRDLGRRPLEAGARQRRHAAQFGADAQLSFSEAGGEGLYQVSSTSSRVGVERLPGVTIDGKVRLPSDEPLSATGSVEIAEEGAPTHIEYDVRSGDAGVLASSRPTPASIARLASASFWGSWPPVPSRPAPPSIARRISSTRR